MNFDVLVREMKDQLFVCLRAVGHANVTQSQSMRVILL